MNRWALTVIVIGVIYAGYRGYARWIGPLTQPPPAPPVAEIPVTPLRVQPGEFGELERFLVEAKWTQQAKFKIRHGQNGYFFFNEYVTDGPRVELRPFAMLLRLESQERGRPYLIAGEAARLTFQNDFQIGGDSPGRLIAAVLEGQYQINGPNSLQITGRDCRFEEASHQLYSDFPLEFVYAPDDGRIRVVRGKADRLQVNFVPSATLSPHGRDLPRVGEIESLTLRRDVQVSFRHLEGTELVSSQVSSAGPFVFKVRERVATFQEQVTVVHPRAAANGTPAFDTLKTHWLALQFEPKPPAAIPSNAVGGRPAPTPPIDEEDSPLGDLQLRTVRALAKDATAPVQLKSMAAGFTGVMSDLLYDAVARTVAMQAPAPGVQFDNGDAQLRSPLVRLEHDAAGELTFAEALREGRLDVERPSTDGGPPQKFHALWTQRLTLRPEPQRELMIVTLEGEARVIQPDGVGILCDRLTLDVDAHGVQSGSGTGLIPGRAATPPAQPVDESSAADRLPLRHALAEGANGRVAMAGPQFEIITSLLDVTFRPGKLPNGPTGGSAGLMRPLRWQEPSVAAAFSQRREECRPKTRSGPSTPYFASVPDPASGDSARRPFGRMDANDHWDIAARGIRALVLQDPATQQAELREVIGEGDVDIQQSTRPPASAVPAAEPPAEPLTVTGDRLHLLNDGGLDQALHLTGAPAHLRQAGMHIEGNELFFDRAANTAQVIGKGMLQAPVGAGLGGTPRETPSQLNVHWLRSMKFDGTIARFIEGVRSRLDDSVMRCDEMEVTLNRRVDFSADRPETEGLAIHNVLCLRGVEVEFYQWETPQEPTGRAVGKAGEFQLRYDTGDFEARGGGRLEAWQRSEERRVDVQPAASAAANQPAATASLPWQYTLVTFQNRMAGNMHRRHATLYDRVSVIHAPVFRSTQVFSRDELSQDTESANHAVWMGCDELQISLHDRPGPTVAGRERDSYVQILGLGKLSRVELEGRLFQANSDTLSYDESTRLFTLRGLGQNKVSLSRQEYPGAPYSDITVQSLQFNPAQRSGSFQGSGGVSGAP